MKEVVDGGVIALLIIAIGPVVSFFADDPEPIRIGIVGTEPVGIEEGLTARAVLSEQEVEITRYDSLAAAEADLKKGTVDALLVDRYSALVAGIITGAAWTVWHYPPLIGTGSPLDTPFWLFGIWVVAATVLMTSVFNASRGSWADDVVPSDRKRFICVSSAPTREPRRRPDYIQCLRRPRRRRSGRRCPDQRTQLAFNNATHHTKSIPRQGVPIKQTFPPIHDEDHSPRRRQNVQSSACQR
ncbi:MAG: hypothetical protein O6923_01025 [Actinobacteria bacterium]|nr:hypothetical protein [Actinomycetota bacterium]